MGLNVIWYPKEMAPSCPGKLLVGRENLEAAWLKDKAARGACGGNSCSAGLELVWRALGSILSAVQPSTLGALLLLVSPIAAQDNFEKSEGKFNGIGDPDFQPALVARHWEIPVQGEAWGTSVHKTGVALHLRIKNTTFYVFAEKVKMEMQSAEKFILKTEL